MSIKKWLEKNTSSLIGKTAVLTGSTGGIGGALAEHLASLGASLVFVDRSLEKSEAHKARLLEKFPDIKIDLITADLADLSSVKRATEALLQINIDSLIHNAGAYSIPRKITEEGFDNVFTINFLSPYYMTKRLLPRLRERRGRVIAVASIAHGYSKTDEVDIDFKSKSRAALVYGNAKRYLMASLASLFDGEEEASLAIAHPGISYTGITSHYPKFVFALIKHPMKLIFMKPKKASLSVLLGLFRPTRLGEWIGPRLFGIWGQPKLSSYKIPSDEAKKIAARAEEIYEKL